MSYVMFVNKISKQSFLSKALFTNTLKNRRKKLILWIFFDLNFKIFYMCEETYCSCFSTNRNRENCNDYSINHTRNFKNKSEIYHEDHHKFLCDRCKFYNERRSSFLIFQPKSFLIFLKKFIQSQNDLNRENHVQSCFSIKHRWKHWDFSG